MLHTALAELERPGQRRAVGGHPAPHAGRRRHGIVIGHTRDDASPRSDRQGDMATLTATRSDIGTAPIGSAEWDLGVTTGLIRIVAGIALWRSPATMIRL